MWSCCFQKSRENVHSLVQMNAPVILSLAGLNVFGTLLASQVVYKLAPQRRVVNLQSPCFKSSYSIPCTNKQLLRTVNLTDSATTCCKQDKITNWRESIHMKAKFCLCLSPELARRQLGMEPQKQMMKVWKGMSHSSNATSLAALNSLTLSLENCHRKCQFSFQLGVGGIDKYCTMVFLLRLLRYNYLPTTLSKETD